MAATKKVEETLAVDLAALLDAGDGAVVTLLAGETRLAAHRAVLAARSPVFAAMFNHNTLEASSGEVTITDVEGPVVRQLLAYCYTLQAPQLPDMASQLLAAADKYGLSGLKAACEKQLAAALAVDTAAETAVLAVTHSCPSLTPAAVAFITAHNYKVMGTEGWADAVRSHPDDLIELSRLLADTPTDARPPEGRANPDTHRQTPAAAAVPTAASDTRPPEDAAAPRLWSPPVGKRLLQAAQKGSVKELRALLAAGADVAARDDCRRTALHCAAEGGHVEAARARCLVESGAEVDAKNSGRRTPLHMAAIYGHTAVVRLLLDASADIHARDCNSRTPLHVAVYYGRVEAAVALMEAGASKEARDNWGRTPYEISNVNDKQVTDMLAPV